MVSCLSERPVSNHVVQCFQSKVNQRLLAPFSFLIAVEEGYNFFKGQHYHCSTHAADVLRTLHVLCTRGEIWKGTNSSDLGDEPLRLYNSPDEIA